MIFAKHPAFAKKTSECPKENQINKKPLGINKSTSVTKNDKSLKSSKLVEALSASLSISYFDSEKLLKTMDLLVNNSITSYLGNKELEKVPRMTNKLGTLEFDQIREAFKDDVEFLLKVREKYQATEAFNQPLKDLCRYCASTCKSCTKPMVTFETCIAIFTNDLKEIFSDLEAIPGIGALEAYDQKMKTVNNFEKLGDGSPVSEHSIDSDLDVKVHDSGIQESSAEIIEISDDEPTEEELRTQMNNKRLRAFVKSTGRMIDTLPPKIRKII